MTGRIQQYRIEGIITEPFRTQVIALIAERRLEDAIKRYNDEYPKALLTSAKEIP